MLVYAIRRILFAFVSFLAITLIAYGLLDPRIRVA
jgi:hypothetical protein